LKAGGTADSKLRHGDGCYYWKVSMPGVQHVLYPLQPFLKVLLGKEPHSNYSSEPTNQLFSNGTFSFPEFRLEGKKGRTGCLQITSAFCPATPIFPPNTKI